MFSVLCRVPEAHDKAIVFGSVFTNYRYVETIVQSPLEINFYRRFKTRTALQMAFNSIEASTNRISRGWLKTKASLINCFSEIRNHIKIITFNLEKVPSDNLMDM